jgi:tRNA pseudouridine55 synthase
VSVDGIVVVNKPGGWTSHDVVAKMRGIAGTRRVGHLGTLDPIATGVLPVMIGQVTRLAQFWERSEKTYEAKIHFGFATTTYDRAGEPVGPVCTPSISADELEAVLEPLRGEIEQVPPPVSAKKVKGVPAYKLARKGEAVELAPVKVTVFELDATEVASTSAKLRIRCSAGTYVRSIAHELGQRLGCGAHVEELVRTQAGPFRIEQARTLEQLQGHLEEAIVPASELLPQFPLVYVDEDTVSRIRQGRDFTVSPFRTNPGAAHVKAIDRAGKLIAIGKIALPNVYHPVIVLN